MGEDLDNNPEKRKWRKKRKNFLSNAKKYGKKGQVGRGAKIPEELYQYFVGILDALKKGIDDEDERKALVNNVLERTKGQEVEIVNNQLGSRVIEILLPHATPEDLERFINILSPDLRKLCSDNFTSHVVETLLRVCCTRATEHLQVNEATIEVPSEKKTESDFDEVPKKKRKLEENSEDHENTSKSDKKQSKDNVNNVKHSEDHVNKCYEFTLKVCKYALNNLEDFVWDNYANHILRSALKCLSGITLLPGEKVNKVFSANPEESKGIPPHQTKLTYKSVPDEFKALVKDFAHRLSSWPQFKDLPYKNLTSALLQVLLYAVKNVDKHVTRDLVKKLLDESFAPENWVSNSVDDKDGKDDKDKIGVDTDKMDGDDDKMDDDNDEKISGDNDDKSVVDSKVNMGGLPPVFDSQPAVRLLEAALFVAKKKTYTQIYARCFINRLARLSTLPMLNFTVQRLIDNCDVKEEFEPMFEELSGKFSDILTSGNSGVLVALAKACLRLRAKQTQFINNLESALGCTEDNQRYFCISCLRLTPIANIDVATLEQPYFIHVHGSVILQTMLQYQRPGKLVQSILELPSEQLLVILCDAKGSHVGDVLCNASGVGVKARDKLIWRLKGYYQKLALSQYGSRTFEHIFASASLEQKVKIITEISEKSNLLNSTQYGRLIANKLDLQGFKTSQKNWEQKWKKSSDKVKNSGDNKE